MLKICLFEPEIPQNTGNIARTCAATGAELHLVHPLGFDISEKAVRHAGLDYWKDVTIVEYPSVDSFMEKHKEDEIYFLSTKGQHIYSDIKYPQDKDIYLIFGKESRGIEEEILLSYPDRVLRIPMINDTRSLNLSNSVAIAAYDYYSKTGFSGFNTEGQLHRHNWEEAYENR